MVRAASKHRWIWFPAAALMVIAAFSAGCAHKPTEPTAGPDSQEPLKVISRIIITDDPGATRVRIGGLGPLVFTAVKRSEPPAVFFYFPDTRLSEDFAETTMAGGVIESVNASEIKEEKNTVRVEIALKTDTAYDVDRSDGELQFTFSQPGDMPESAGSMGAENSEEPIVDETAAPLPAVEDKVPLAAAPPPPAATRLISVNSRPLGNGVRVDVKADGRIENYNDFTIDTPARIVFDIFDVKSASKKEEAILVNTPWVKQVRHYGDASKLRLVLDTRETYLKSYSADPVADGLVIQVFDPGAVPDKIDASAASRVAGAPSSSGTVPMPVDTPEKPLCAETDGAGRKPDSRS